MTVFLKIVGIDITLCLKFLDSNPWQTGPHSSSYDYSSAALGSSDAAHPLMPPSMSAMTYPMTSHMASMTSQMSSVSSPAGPMVDTSWASSSNKSVNPGWNAAALCTSGFPSIGSGDQLGGFLSHAQGYNMAHASHSVTAAVSHDKSHASHTSSYPSYFSQFPDPSLMCAGRVH